MHSLLTLIGKVVIGADPGGQVPCSNPGLDPAGIQG